MNYPRDVLLAILLVQLVNRPGKVSSTDVSNKPSWVYECVPNEGCQQEARTKAKDKQPGYYKSISVCRLHCSQNKTGTVWPIPSKAYFGLKTREIHPDLFKFSLVDVPPVVQPILTKMIHITMRNLQVECRGNLFDSSSSPVFVNITVKAEETSLFWNIDESYTLKVVETHDPIIYVKVKAATMFGARHALETLVQLVVSDLPLENTDNKCKLKLLVGTEITDTPTYTHRGLLLDTARHFIPIENIKKMIEGMGATKMNVFHWHVTDSHSFPLQSASVPQLTRYGANSPTEIYTTEQVRALVDFALVHGVRVVIEIDTPGHAGNGWQWGKEEHLGDLAVCVNAEPWKNYCLQPPCGQLNPLNPNTYTVLGKLYRDIIDLLPDPVLLHVGGDEINFNCWNSSQELKKLMIKKGLDLSQNSFFYIWNQFHKEALKVWDVAVNYTKLPVMIWSSELTDPKMLAKHDLSKERYVIEVWASSRRTPLNKLLKAGYRIVAAPNDIWYLDYESHWTTTYSLTLPTVHNMLGGETAMWTEFVDTMGLDARIWPRAAAVAERLWSNPNTKAELAEPRLQMLRERLINRGLRPGAVSSVWCSHNDMKCS